MTENDSLTVYFACVGNSGRSQMAQAFAEALGENVEAQSGGTDPKGHVLEHVRTAMAEVGVPVLGQSSTPIDDDTVANADAIVTMGCGADACPAFLNREVEDWPLDDPDGASLDEVREIRDEVATRVRRLLRERGRLADDTGYEKA
jgi:ArsR family transcriptional regulator